MGQVLGALETCTIDSITELVSLPGLRTCAGSRLFQEVERRLRVLHIEAMRPLIKSTVTDMPA